MSLRQVLRRFVYTQNTIRYRVEWTRLLEAWKRIPEPIESVCDGGAGSGEYCRKLLASQLCKSVTCVEFDPMNYQRLVENLGGRSDSTLVRGSVLELPLADSSVDLVMSTQVLEHIEDHEKAASEFNRVLKPNGYGIISVPHPPEPFPNDGHVREGYTEADLTALFAPYGWTPLWTDYFLVRDTVNAMLLADKFSRCYIPLPVAWVDKETDLNWNERRDRLPFGIMMLFKKPA